MLYVRQSIHLYMLCVIVEFGALFRRHCEDEWATRLLQGKHLSPVLNAAQFLALTSRDSQQRTYVQLSASFSGNLWHQIMSTLYSRVLYCIRPSSQCRLFQGFLPAFVRLGPQTIITFLLFEQLRMNFGYVKVT